MDTIVNCNGEGSEESRISGRSDVQLIAVGKIEPLF